MRDLSEVLTVRAAARALVPSRSMALLLFGCLVCVWWGVIVGRVDCWEKRGAMAAVVEAERGTAEAERQRDRG